MRGLTLPDRIEDLRRDDRAIEGLPIRLVIALVVGLASLGVMMNMISGLSGLGVTELDVQPEPDVVAEGERAVNVTVVDPSGGPVANATVVAKADTARLGDVAIGETGYDGSTTLDLAVSLTSNQVDGTVSFDVHPPSGDYEDRRENRKLLVVKDGSAMARG